MPFRTEIPESITILDSTSDTMSRDENGANDGAVGTDRRRFLAVLGLAAVGSAAGCSGVTEQSFEAEQAGLPDTAQEELALVETDSSSESLSRDGPTGNVEVTVTNHTAVYSRAAGLGGS